MDTTHKRAVGPMIGLIVILLIIIIGGIYFWQTRAHSNPDNGFGATNTENKDDISQIETQSSSDETSAIDSDLNAYSESDIDSVDNDL